MIAAARTHHHLCKSRLGNSINLIIRATINNVRTPCLVIVATAIFRAAHFAVTGVKVATKAQRKAVGFVWTEMNARQEF